MYTTDDTFYPECFLKPMCLLVIGRGDGDGRVFVVCWFDFLGLGLYFPQIKHFSVICSHFQYYQVLENITFSWGDTGYNCLFIRTSFTLTQAYLHHVHLWGRKSSPLDYSTVWIGENFSQQLEVCSAVNSFFFFFPFHSFIIHSTSARSICIPWFAKYLHCLFSECCE